MMQGDPFDVRPDPVLGARLRASLELGDDTRFVEGVLARLAVTPRPLEVLAAWARPGIAAALVIAAALGYWETRQSLNPAGPDLAEIAAGDPTLDHDTLLVVALDDTP